MTHTFARKTLRQSGTEIEALWWSSVAAHPHYENHRYGSVGESACKCVLASLRLLCTILMRSLQLKLNENAANNVLAREHACAMMQIKSLYLLASSWSSPLPPSPCFSSKQKLNEQLTLYLSTVYLYLASRLRESDNQYKQDQYKWQDMS